MASRLDGTELSMGRKIPNRDRVEDLTFGPCCFHLYGTRSRRELGMYNRGCPDPVYE